MKTILASTLALSLTFILGCKEEKKPKPSESTEQPEAVAEETKGNDNLCGGKELAGWEFCFEGNVYNKCDGVEYDPKTHGCCDQGPSSNRYDLETSFCFPPYIVDKCGGKEYDPSTHYCENDKIKENKCEGNSYDSEMKFCHNGKLYDKCDLGTYYESYNPDTHFCYSPDMDIKEKCGGKEYDPETQKCENGQVVAQ